VGCETWGADYCEKRMNTYDKMFHSIDDVPEQCLTCSNLLGDDYKDDGFYCRPEALLEVFDDDDPELDDRVTELTDQAAEGECLEHTAEQRQDRYVPYHNYDIELGDSSPSGFDGED
jgi:hypothetical protein